MKLSLTTAAASVSFLALAHTALAEPPVCRAGYPCVYDTNNKFVGLAGTIDTLFRFEKTQQKWFQVQALAQGLAKDMVFFYTEEHCTGDVNLDDIGILPTPMVYDGAAFFAPAHSGETFIWQSYSAQKLFDRGGKCTNWGPSCTGSGPCQGIGGPAILIETVSFAPPFHTP